VLTVLHAFLTADRRRAARPEEIRAVAELRNAGDTPTEIDPVLISSPSLALEITDDDGRPLLLPPPPLPSEQDSRVILGPGESYRATYRSFLPAWTNRGTYSVRIRYRGTADPVTSDWLTIAVGEDQ